MVDMSIAGERNRELYHRCWKLGIFPRSGNSNYKLVSLISEYMDFVADNPHNDWYEWEVRTYEVAWEIWWGYTNPRPKKRPSSPCSCSSCENWHGCGGRVWRK